MEITIKKVKMTLFRQNGRIKNSRKGFELTENPNEIENISVFIISLKNQKCKALSVPGTCFLVYKIKL
jgi:hypothetical protein